MEGSPDEAALPAPFMYAPEAPAPEAPPAPVDAPAPAPQPVPVPEPAPAPTAEQMPLRGKLRAPIPKEARADPFAKMKKSTGKHHSKPAHRPPSGLQGTCAWNCSLGRWEADVKLKPRDGDYVFSEDYRSWVRQRSAAPAPAQAPFAFDDDSSNDDEDPPPKRACPEPNKRRRPFQPSWKTVLPMLVFSLGLGCVCNNRKVEQQVADGTFICPVDPSCPGCFKCGRMVCTTCVEKGCIARPRVSLRRGASAVRHPQRGGPLRPTLLAKGHEEAKATLARLEAHEARKRGA